MSEQSAVALTGLKLKLAETIAVRAAAQPSPAERELFLQRQHHAMIADGRAAGMDTPDADEAASRVMEWVRRLVTAIEGRANEAASATR